MDSKETLGITAADNSTSIDMIFLIMLLIIVVSLIVYMLYKPMGGKITESKEPSSYSPNETKNIPNDEKNEYKLESNKPMEVAKPKPEAATTTVKKEEKTTTSESIKEPQPKIKEPEIVVPEIEEQSKEKYIGYNPINIFAQTEPLYFPYVMMPKPNCVIKFPRKGRAGRKGYKEEAFKEYIIKYFKSNYQVFDDRFILIKNSKRPYEPDFTLINEVNGINIFVDIEIDEPYEGTNDIENRKPTHYKYSDTNRNLAFTNRGWIVIRFAEIQVHQQPDACCKFIAHILKSINPQFNIPEGLINQDKIQPVLQWTDEDAKQWSLEKYREKYLGIERFGVTANENVIQEIEETDLGKTVEEKVVDDEIIDGISFEKKVDTLTKINLAVYSGKYLSFSFNNEKTIFKPVNINDKELSGFCFVKNEIKIFTIYEMENIEIKNNYYTQQIAGHRITVEQISNIVNTAIDYQKYIRMKYTRAGWRSVYVDLETGELIEEKITSEESIRTISDVQLSINALDQEHIENYRLNSDYLTAYCHKREEQRTFKFERISEIEILDI